MQGQTGSATALGPGQEPPQTWHRLAEAMIFRTRHPREQLPHGFSTWEPRALSPTLPQQFHQVSHLAWALMTS